MYDIIQQSISIFMTAISEKGNWVSEYEFWVLTMCQELDKRVLSFSPLSLIILPWLERGKIRDEVKYPPGSNCTKW